MSAPLSGPLTSKNSAAGEILQPQEALLEVANLQVSYGAIRALFDVSLKVFPGEIVTLLGSNGAGKTTTLRAISGLEKVRGGSICFEGSAIHHGLQAFEVVRKGLAHSPEGRRIFGNLTVEENLDMGAFIRATRTVEDKRAIQEDLEQVFRLFPRLKERLPQVAGTLSGGEQQMLAIARALMQRPKLLMLDEPSLGIAPVLVEAIFRALIEINKNGTTLLVVEQNAAAALSIAHRAYVLETGRTTLSGKAHELAKDPRVIAAYLGH
jgi:branched-chain amino acid transport system ATP-binding protein